MILRTSQTTSVFIDKMNTQSIGRMDSNIYDREIVDAAVGYNTILYVCGDGSLVELTFDLPDLHMYGEERISTIDIVSVASWRDNAYLLLHVNGTVSMLHTDNHIEQIPNLQDIVYMSSDDDHALFLTADGHVYGMGNNTFHQLSQDEVIYYNNPVLLPIDNVKSISCDNAYSLFHKHDSNKVYMSGLHYYQDGEYTDSTLREIADIDNIDNIYAGHDHLFITTKNGDVYGYGDASYGVFGNGDTVGTIYDNPVLLTIKNTVDISCNGAFSIFSLSNGKNIGCGNNAYGQITKNIVYPLEIYL